jgi:hypothetical protein
MIARLSHAARSQIEPAIQLLLASPKRQAIERRSMTPHQGGDARSVGVAAPGKLGEFRERLRPLAGVVGSDGPNEPLVVCLGSRGWGAEQARQQHCHQNVAQTRDELHGGFLLSQADGACAVSPRAAP